MSCKSGMPRSPPSTDFTDDTDFQRRNGRPQHHNFTPVPRDDFVRMVLLPETVITRSVRIYPNEILKSFLRERDFPCLVRRYAGTSQSRKPDLRTNSAQRNPSAVSGLPTTQARRQSRAHVSKHWKRKPDVFPSIGKSRRRGFQGLEDRRESTIRSRARSPKLCVCRGAGTASGSRGRRARLHSRCWPPSTKRI